MQTRKRLDSDRGGRVLDALNKPLGGQGKSLVPLHTRGSVCICLTGPRRKLGASLYLSVPLTPRARVKAWLVPSHARGSVTTYFSHGGQGDA